LGFRRVFFFAGKKLLSFWGKTRSIVDFPRENEHFDFLDFGKKGVKEGYFGDLGKI
jgi:hypothetical protein